MKSINCPICGEKMKIRQQVSEHLNKRYMQYHCRKCDDDDTGYVTDESQEYFSDIDKFLSH